MGEEGRQSGWLAVAYQAAKAVHLLVQLNQVWRPSEAGMHARWVHSCLAPAPASSAGLLLDLSCCV
jgi:hypothetical protein